MKPKYTQFPFKLPDICIEQLPSVSGDGLIYFDFRIQQKWDGVLVAKPDGECIGYYFARRVIDRPIALLPEAIEAVRRPCVGHRIYTSLPLAWLDFVTANLISLWIICPVLFFAGRFWMQSLFYAVIALSILSIVATKRHGGFFSARFPIEITAIVWLLISIAQLLR